MRFHRHLCDSIVIILQQIFVENFYADKVIERQFKLNKKWGKRDREFVASSVYEIVRWWRLYWFILGQDISMDQTSLLNLLGVHFLKNGVEVPDWMNRERLSTGLIMSRLDQIENPAIEHSLPDWMMDEFVNQELEGLDDILQILNVQSPLILRSNSLKITRDELIKKLKSLDLVVKQHPKSSCGIIFEEKYNVFGLEDFKNGLFEVQDGNSQQIAEFCEVKPGDFVIDACAGAGGKTLHLAALMQNKGKIIAMDIHEKKLAAMKLRLRRAGVDNVEARVIDSNKITKRLENKADVLLLDVPCSGTGVIRRNPDSKWKLSRQKLRELEQIQVEILRDYSSMLKSGGRLVYSTCSLFPSENRKQIDFFLQSEAGKSFHVVKEQTLNPTFEGADGFYMCLLMNKQG